MSSNAFHALLSGLLSDIEVEGNRLQAAYDREKSALVSGDDVDQLVACAALGSIVSKIYTKAEDFFSKIAKKIDQDLPVGDGWPIDLFRHFERNSYASDLSPDLIPKKVELALAAIPNLKRDFTAFSSEFFDVTLVPKHSGDVPRT